MCSTNSHFSANLFQIFCWKIWKALFFFFFSLPCCTNALLPCNHDTGSVFCFSQHRHKAHGNVHVFQFLQLFKLQVAPLTPIKPFTGMCHGAHCVCLWFPALNLLTLQKNFADRLNGSQQQMWLLPSQSLWCMCQVKSLNSLFHFNNSLWEWVWPPGDHSTCPPIYLSLLWPQSTASLGWIFSFWLAGADRINPTLLLYSGLSLNSSLGKSTELFH